MRARSPLLLLALAACNARTGSPPVPIPHDTPPRPLIAADGTYPNAPALPPWTARVEPPAPRWDQDLRCVIEGLPPEVAVAIVWTVNGHLFESAAQVERPGDTIPHLQQAGGQVWSCTAATADETQTAQPVSVEPPLPMAMVRPGSFQFSAYVQHWEVYDPVTITRPYWIAKYEMTHAEYEAWTGHQAYEGWDAPRNNPVTYLSSWDAQVLANLLSVRDGLPECYTCQQRSPVRTDCVEVDNLPACPGYRLPTAAEWEFASTSGGKHNDPLPAGGIWAWTSSREIGDTGNYNFDPPAVGPNAPLNSLVSDQCWFANGINRSIHDVGLLLPNELGLYDMCGNASEVVSDDPTLNPAWEGFVDPHSRPGSIFAIGGGVNALPTGSWSRIGFGQNTTIRLVRTHTPVPTPGALP
jgi:formylglycine-generating enzyme required for sulfatase activity